MLGKSTKVHFRVSPLTSNAEITNSIEWNKVDHYIEFSAVRWLILIELPKTIQPSCLYQLLDAEKASNEEWLR